MKPKSPELNAALGLISIGLMFAVPNLQIPFLVGEFDLSIYSSGVHVFFRLGLLLVAAHFFTNAAGGKK